MSPACVITSGPVPASTRAEIKAAVSSEFFTPMSPYANTRSGHAVALSPTTRGATKRVGAVAPQRPAASAIE